MQNYNGQYGNIQQTRSTKSNNSNTGCIIAGCLGSLGCLGIIILALILIFGFGKLKDYGSEYLGGIFEESGSGDNSGTEVPDKEDEKSLQEEVEEAEITPDQFADIESMLESLGIPLESMKRAPSYDDSVEPGDRGYALNETSEDSPGTAIIMMLKDDNSLQKVTYAEAPLFENGVAVNHMDNFRLSPEEEEEYSQAAEELVRDELKYPDTAVFSNQGIIKYDGVITIAGKVEAQTDSGNTALVDYSIQYDLEGYVTQFIIDGEDMLAE